MTLNKEEFQNPGAVWRGKPFWAWNGKLEQQELLRQANAAGEMGFGGYFMHSRTGLGTEYLSDEWFQLTNRCADHAQENNMEAWLYDEDRWPSGSAGGLVTQNELYRAQFICMEQYDEQRRREFIWSNNTVYACACVLAGKCFFNCRRIEAESNVSLLAEDETLLVFSTERAKCDSNYNGYTYADTMSKEAMQCYISLTHESYRKNCGKRLGSSIKGIFTDEPHRGPLFTTFSGGAENKIPYTEGLFEIFRKRFGYDIKVRLPEVFLRKNNDDLSKAAHDYIELCQELFLQHFAKPIHQWCEKNHMILTGHALQEDSLSSQTIMQGSLMRFYEHMDYPGVDVLTEGNENWWLAKQVVSVARQLQKTFVLSELYGCTGWKMTFQDYKFAGDWQALFGINLRCPHLSWYTMQGEAKRDYPASMFHQSAWYREFSAVETYFSRLHVALQGSAVCDLLVMNPIESVWAHAYSGAFANLDAQDSKIEALEQIYRFVFTTLCAEHIDFDYGEEDIMARHAKVENGILYIGVAAYRKVLVAGMETIREDTLNLLKEFRRQGGTVVFAGELPRYVNVTANKTPMQFASQCTCVTLAKDELCAAVRSGKEVLISGEGANKIFVQSKCADNGVMTMLLNMDRSTVFSQLQIKIPCAGYSKIEKWDPRTGKVSIPQASIEDGCFVLYVSFEAGEEKLYRICQDSEAYSTNTLYKYHQPLNLLCGMHYTLHELNICVLDSVEVETERNEKIDCCEVLRADQKLRGLMGLELRGGSMVQPWHSKYRCKQEKSTQREICLRYTVNVSATPSACTLVVEALETMTAITVNGESVPLHSCGKWIDVCFDQLQIDGLLKMGSNEIVLYCYYDEFCGIEAVYLLGNFGVKLTESGTKPYITQLPTKLALGDIGKQGLLFYSGKITYWLDQPCTAPVHVKVTQFHGACVALVEQEHRTVLPFAPFEGTAKQLCGIELTLTRRCTFGPLHNLPKNATAYGPQSFVSEGSHWSDAYVLIKQGLYEVEIAERIGE